MTDANKVRAYLENNTKAAKEYGEQLTQLAKQMESVKPAHEQRALKQQA